MKFTHVSAIAACPSVGERARPAGWAHGHCPPCRGGHAKRYDVKSRVKVWYCPRRPMLTTHFPPWLPARQVPIKPINPNTGCNYAFLHTCKLSTLCLAICLHLSGRTRSPQPPSARNPLLDHSCLYLSAMLIWCQQKPIVLCTSRRNRTRENAPNQ